MSADDELAHHAGYAEKHYAHYVYQNEGCTAILSNHVWEAPYVA